MKKILIFTFLILIVLISCRDIINPVDPKSDLYIGEPSVDIDGDGIGQYEDVDEIKLAFPVDGEIISQFPIVLSTNSFNLEKITKFHVQVSTNIDFSGTNIIDNDEFTSNECIISTDGFLNGTQYFWRIKAYDGSKWSDDWSEIRSFTLGIDFTMPQVTFPLDDSSITVTTPTLSWTDATGATEYHIEVNTSNSFDETIIANENVFTETQHIITTALSDNTTYYWHVKIKNEDGVWGDWSSTWSFTVSLPIPIAPSELLVNSVSATEIDLTWFDNSQNEDGFRIEYKIGVGGTYSLLETLEPNISEYNHTGLSPATTYFYRINAFNSDGDSNYSNEISVITSGVDYAILNPVFPTTGIIDTSYDVSFTIKNMGSVIGAQGVTWTAYRSEDTVVNSGDVIIATANISALSAGAESPVITISDTWPVAADTYYLIIEVYASDDGNISNNNEFSNLINVATPFIDYTINNESYPDMGIVNDAYSGSFVIENSGNIAGTQTINWSVYRSNNSVYDSSVDIQIDSGTLASLGAGQTTSIINFNDTWPGSTGTQYLIIVISVNDDSDTTNNTEISNAITVNPEPIGLSITGPSEVNENSSANYSTILSFSDGSSQIVTPVWSENSPSYASVNSSGTVATGNVLSNQTFTLTATCCGFTATKTITIIYIRVATGIDIDGPSYMDESGIEDYDADIIYDNGSEQAISPSWSENSYYASVDSNGTVFSQPVSSNSTFTLTASYGGFTDTKTITIEDEVINTPSVSSEPSELEDGVSGTFYASSVSSNLGHSIQYRFDWGDGSYSSWSSSRSASHSWSTRGTKYVKTQARCATHTSEVSSWSSSRSVRIFSIGHTNIWNDTHYAIPDNTGNWISSTLPIPGPIPSASEIVNVWWNFGIRHDNRNELKIWITTYYNNTWVGDDLYFPGDLGTYSGYFSRSGNSSVFNDIDHLTGQVWYLSVFDQWSNNDGDIEYFEIVVAYKYY